MTFFQKIHIFKDLQGGAVRGDVTDGPDYRTGGEGEQYGAPENEDGPVYKLCVNGLQDPGRPVGRQLEAERGNLAAQPGA